MKPTELAAKRSKCVRWLTSSCHGGTECTCVSRKDLRKAWRDAAVGAKVKPDA